MNQPMRWATAIPCNSCPYRKDAPRELWSREEFYGLLRNDRDELGGAIYGCHGTRKVPEGPSICAGWLLDQKRRGLPAIQLRLSLMRSEAARTNLESVSNGGHELYSSIREMCAANGVDEEAERPLLRAIGDEA